MNEVLDLTVGELLVRGDCTVALERGWRVGILTGITSSYSLISSSLSEDLFFLEWRGFKHSRAVHLIGDVKVGELVDAWRDLVRGDVRKHLNAAHARLSLEMDELGALEVALLGS